MADARERARAPRPASGAGSLRVGRLTKPHGLKGGIKLELFTDNPELRFVPGAIFHLQVPEDSPWFGRTITMRELRWFNDAPVGFFEELPDRTAAEGIVRAILWIDEQAVAAGEEENAWYDHQLVGMSVVRDDAVLGTVAEVQHFPAQDLLAVTTDRGTVLVPFVEAIVPSVDVEAGVVRVTPPTGLFDDADGADGPGEVAESAGAGETEDTGEAGGR
ncbi:ribosome maturation factor RimM [Leucobacter triazinivorans]|uniref:Ribosome maturation factor RimM n=1 Tax=Leucobacter triazinivorans TaxID=1784719 RepID=A0A4P6KIX8_9MICO|nr:ribosome maturation factor RimM [Leucobacter triazinivorans]QBE50061.1 ribosome maturation factor RimM [Leucobacter triazinivorans]